MDLDANSDWLVLAVCRGLSFFQLKTTNQNTAEGMVQRGVNARQRTDEGQEGGWERECEIKR